MNLNLKTRNSKLNLFIFLALITIPVKAADFQDTWSNWNTRWETAFKNVPSRKLPGRAMGILIPSDTRDDILPLSAFGYEVLNRTAFHTVIILMPAPADYPMDGIVMPGLTTIETSFGRFPVDTALRDQIVSGGAAGITIDPNLFLIDIPKLLQRQLSGLKFILKKNISTLNVLPMYVRFSDINSSVKDLAPYVVDRIRTFGMDQDVAFVILSNGSRAPSEEKLVPADAALLKNLRGLDIEGLLASSTDTVKEDLSTLMMGVLTMRWMGADHAEVFAYAHSGQLVLTKDKRQPLSYLSAGFASQPPFSPRVPHIKQEKMTEIFGELLRSDLLALARQTCLSTIDSTAAKPPAINNPQSAKKWPVYVTLFDAQGKLAGQAGTHVATGPLEESIRQYTFEATRAAQPDLNKSNASTYVIEVSIPYGFDKVPAPDDYIALLHGIVVSLRLKTKAIHPDAWRLYPDPHQLLGAICTRLGADPWTYGTLAASLESFRVLSFNEKEPFQDLGSSKKKKKKNADETEDEGGGGGAGGPGMFTF